MRPLPPRWPPVLSRAGAVRVLRRQLHSPAFASPEEGSYGSSVNESSTSGGEGKATQFVRRSTGTCVPRCWYQSYLHCLTSSGCRAPSAGQGQGVLRLLPCCLRSPSAFLAACSAWQSVGRCGGALRPLPPRPLPLPRPRLPAGPRPHVSHAAERDAAASARACGGALCTRVAAWCFWAPSVA